MVKDILIVADLGAAGNLVRNLLLLSDEVDWPLLTPRLETILAQYTPGTDLSNWLSIEYKLRHWRHFYGVDLSDDININTFNKRLRPAKPVVYLNHSAFYQPAEYQQLRELVTPVFVAPTSEFGVIWQVRSYCEKKTVPLLHNFTFETDVEAQREAYCKQHGEEAYYKLNVQNFKAIVRQRQLEHGTPDLALETLLYRSAAEIVEQLHRIVNVSISAADADAVITAWRQLHWPTNQTLKWKIGNVYSQLH